MFVFRKVWSSSSHFFAFAPLVANAVLKRSFSYRNVATLGNEAGVGEGDQFMESKENLIISEEEEDDEK